MPSLLRLATLAFTGLPAAVLMQAQTATHHTAASAAHHAAATPAKTAAKPAGPPCMTLPPISDKIPALPASAGCPKVMFTVSDRLDYLNPLAERFRSSLFADLPVIISLGYADLVQGTGELAKPQQWYTVKYTGYLTDGTKFDASSEHEETSNGFSFPYGAHRVIAGWDLGFEGMRVGGKRRLYVPYQFAYGAGGKPPEIPPRSMLIFDMEFLAQSATPPAPPAPPKPPTPPVSTTPGVQAQPAPSGAPPTGNTPQTGPDTKPNPPVAGQPSTAPTSQPQDTKPQPPE